jgi:hypothetical protein
MGKQIVTIPQLRVPLPGHKGIGEKANIVPMQRVAGGEIVGVGIRCRHFGEAPEYSSADNFCIRSCGRSGIAAPLDENRALCRLVSAGVRTTSCCSVAQPSALTLSATRLRAISRAHQRQDGKWRRLREEERGRRPQLCSFEAFEAHLEAWTREVADVRIHGKLQTGIGTQRTEVSARSVRRMR